MKKLVSSWRKIMQESYLLSCQSILHQIIQNLLFFSTNGIQTPKQITARFLTGLTFESSKSYFLKDQSKPSVSLSLASPNNMPQSHPNKYSILLMMFRPLTTSIVFHSKELAARMKRRMTWVLGLEIPKNVKPLMLTLRK